MVDDAQGIGWALGDVDGYRRLGELTVLRETGLLDAF